MTNEASPELNTAADVLARLREIARQLREGQHLGREAKQLLAELVDELGKTLESQTLPPVEAAHLAKCTTELMQSVHQREETHIIADARDRLEKAIVAVEARSPMLAGLFERLVDALANLGI